MTAEAGVIRHVYLWQNGMVMVFDQHGQQMPEYQGAKEDVWERVCRDAPSSAEFSGGAWRERTWAIERDG